MFGERLRELRKWRGMTQVRLARSSGVAQNYISELESGVATNPSHEVIQRLVNALDVSPAELTAVARPHVVLPTPPSTLEPPPLLSGHQYRGYRILAARPDGESYTDQVVVEVNGQPLPAHYWNSSGVEWGYQGAGPTALAYDLLAYEFDTTLARNHLTNFTEAVVARFPRVLTGDAGSHLQWTLSGQEIRDWLLQQGRPDHVSVYWSARDWVVRADGPAQMLVHAQFLPEHRLVLELERREYANSTTPVVRWAIEEEWRTGASHWPAWHHVREVEPHEYFLFPA
jgi:transcriptional regulator with XRE-family HTH domain